MSKNQTSIKLHHWTGDNDDRPARLTDFEEDLEFGDENSSLDRYNDDIHILRGGRSRERRKRSKSETQARRRIF